MELQRMILFPQELEETRCQTQPPSVKKYLKEKTKVIIHGPNFVSIKFHN